MSLTEVKQEALLMQTEPCESVEINITVIIDFNRTLLITVGLYHSASANASLASSVADEHKVAAVLRLSGRHIIKSPITPQRNALEK